MSRRETEEERKRRILSRGGAYTETHLKSAYAGECRTWEHLLENEQVCDRWRQSFACFLADQGARPSGTHRLQRIDPALPFQPRNCMWVDEGPPSDEKPSAKRTRERRERYVAYLRSPEWQARRELALEAADGRCQVCYDDKSLHVHHRTYRRFAAEVPSDLTVLCDGCHELFHKNRKLKTVPA